MTALLSPETVAGAATAWVWYPPDAEVVETERYLLVRFPDHFGEPLQLLRTTGPADEALLAEVRARAARWQVAPQWRHVTWWVRLDAPAGLEELLRARGELDETLTVLARPVGADTGDLPDLAVPTDVEVHAVDSVTEARHAHEVEAAVFGGSVPDAARLGAVVEECRADRRAGAGERLVAYLDGDPVGTAGLSLVDGVARLWGACVLETARGRGVYRALLDERLRWGARHGAHLALVKGRVQTSAPVLRRAGFAAYGEERSYRLTL